jgi:hypothetical protein
MVKNKIYRIRFNELQIKSLDKLKSYNVNVPKFIRCAIKEKIKKDWPEIKQDIINRKIPF